MFANRGHCNHSTFSTFNSPPKSNFYMNEFEFSRKFTVFYSLKKIALFCAFRKVALIIR